MVRIAFIKEVRPHEAFNGCLIEVFLFNPYIFFNLVEGERNLTVKTIYIYWFLEKKERREEKKIDVREKRGSVASDTCPYPGSARNLGMCPVWESSHDLSV